MGLQVIIRDREEQPVPKEIDMGRDLDPGIFGALLQSKAAGSIFLGGSPRTRKMQVASSL